jgi:hypothetical protein
MPDAGAVEMHLDALGAGEIGNGQYFFLGEYRSIQSVLKSDNFRWGPKEEKSVVVKPTRCGLQMNISS